jgi:curli biogenesis system outer membrane secretion channel CsgG
MNIKKSLPVIFLVVLAIIALALKRCNQPSGQHSQSTRREERNIPVNKPEENGKVVPFDRRTSELFFTKHAKCRMKCRQISQQEVKDILLNGKVNYNKSDLNDPKGPTYAIEGFTNDQQHVRIIFAPKQTHLTVVTVIDLDVEHLCNCA